jgi:hypothetical protein
MLLSFPHQQAPSIEWHRPTFKPKCGGAGGGARNIMTSENLPKEKKKERKREKTLSSPLTPENNNTNCHLERC